MLGGMVEEENLRENRSPSGYWGTERRMKVLRGFLDVVHDDDASRAHALAAAIQVSLGSGYQVGVVFAEGSGVETGETDVASGNGFR